MFALPSSGGNSGAFRGTQKTLVSKPPNTFVDPICSRFNYIIGHVIHGLLLEAASFRIESRISVNNCNASSPSVAVDCPIRVLSPLFLIAWQKISNILSFYTQLLVVHFTFTACGVR